MKVLGSVTILLKGCESMKCKWELIDEDAGVYETECDNMHYFVSDGPTENKYKYCPYCGKELEDNNGN